MTEEHELEPMLAVMRGRIKDAELLLRECKQREYEILNKIGPQIEKYGTLTLDIEDENYGRLEYKAETKMKLVYDSVEGLRHWIPVDGPESPQVWVDENSPFVKIEQ